MVMIITVALVSNRRQFKETCTYQNDGQYFLNTLYVQARAQLGKFEGGGRRYICDSKDEIIHGLNQSLQCVAPLLETCP